MRSVNTCMAWTLRHSTFVRFFPPQIPIRSCDLRGKPSSSTLREEGEWVHRIITQFLGRDAPIRAGVPAMRRDRRRAYENHSRTQHLSQPSSIVCPLLGDSGENKRRNILGGGKKNFHFHQNSLFGFVPVVSNPSSTSLPFLLHIPALTK